MGTSTFARRVLWSLVLFVLGALLILAVEMGAFGGIAQTWLRAYVTLLHQAYLDSKYAVDLVIVIVGTMIPAVTGGLTILRGFYYADWNLPRRLQELADAEREQHLHQRPKLIGYVRSPFKTTDFLTPTILANPFSLFLQLFGWTSIRNQAREFATSVDKFAGEIKVLACKTEDIENRKVTGHLLRGAYFETQAANSDASTLEWKKSIESALNEYEAALSLRPDDLDALEGASAQAHRLGQESKELDFLNTTIRVAGSRKKHLTHARALRRSAAIIEQRISPLEWNNARARLVTARREIEHKATPGTPEGAELAETLLLYGEVQTKREKFTTARKALNRANALFKIMEGEAGEKGKKRVKQAFERLDEAAGDKEAVGG